MAGLATALSFVKINALWANGGSISFEMIPLFLVAFRHGWKVGVLTGLIAGFTGLLSGASIFHPIQFVLDYPVAFALIGLAGVFVRKRQVPNLSVIVLGILLGTLLRFMAHFTSGVVYFAEFTPDGWNDYIYSAAYNASYLVPQMIITLIPLLIISKNYPQFFKVKPTL